MERKLADLAEGKLPVTAGGDDAVLPLKPFAGRNFLDAVDERPGAGNVVECEIAIEAFGAEATRNFWMDEEGFKLGAEVEVLTNARVVKGLDAHAIAGEDEAFLRLVPEGDGEHAAEALEAGGVPLEKGF